ncbi:mediator of RNA polymerase II transcription subunit 11 isoform X2 [Lepisosteus oculatus]|uniref:mediator of RNA polymerase II transcription subunit 11 isoform X2 n=1 Tax=Lepisosteus oculatus TaxID=7918 RepID=UPI00073FE133|nr:PREDICTED: mediator of RNA polymerase II transcription subunit 11 isoform X2 [Lepisosteus oculatus]
MCSVVKGTTACTGSIVLELSKEKHNASYLERQLTQFTSSVNRVESELSSQIRYLTQVATGQPHEGSTYSARKDCQMALNRADYARVKLGDLGRTCELLLDPQVKALDRAGVHWTTGPCSTEVRRGPACRQQESTDNKNSEGEMAVKGTCSEYGKPHVRAVLYWVFTSLQTACWEKLSLRTSKAKSSGPDMTPGHHTASEPPSPVLFRDDVGGERQLQHAVVNCLTGPSTVAADI